MIRLNDLNIDYLSFDNNISIDSDRSEVVFAPNGLCKTSICNALKNQYEEDFFFTDFEDLTTSLNYKKKEIEIKINEEVILGYSKIIEDNIKNMNIKKNLSAYNIKNIRSAEISYNISQMYNSLEFQYEIFNVNLIEIQDFLNFMIDNNLSKIHLLQIVEVIEDLRRYIITNQFINDHEQYLKEKLYKYALKINETRDNICPVCGSNITDLIQQIHQKREHLVILENNIVNKIHDVLDLVEVNELITALDGISNFNLEYMLLMDVYENSSGSQWIKIFADNIFRVIENNECGLRIHTLLEDRNEKYNILKNYKEEIDNSINLKDSLVETYYNDDNLSITFKFNRAIGTFSIAERNNLKFILNLYTFVGSNRQTIILDDVLSSYDLRNQYKIVYNLIDICSRHNLKFIVFTHNINFIRILKYQYNNIAKSILLDKINDEIIEHSNGVFNDVEDNNFQNEYICLLLARCGIKTHLFDTIRQIGNYFEPINVTYDDSSNIHSLFHYEGMYKKAYISSDASDEYHSIIDQENIVNTSINTSDENIFEQKVLKICSLRILAENILYSLLTSDERKNEFIDKRTLKDKINYVLPRSGIGTMNEHEKKIRKILTSRKVLYNDIMHPNSKINLIFDYAFGIPCDELLEEEQILLELIN